MSHTKNLLVSGRLLLPAVACLLVGSPVWAQDSNYKVGENQSAPAPTAPPAVTNKQTTDEPQRLARFDYINGDVTWRSDAGSDWSKAVVRLPLRQGAQISVTKGGRAEIRFDDGSLLRLGNGAVATLKTLYNDAQGEFTEIKLTSGLATLRPRAAHSIYQVDTPVVTVTAAGPARVRVGVADTVEIGVNQGSANVEGKQGKINLIAGDYLCLEDANSPYDLRSLPREDSWERWNDARDRDLGLAPAVVHVHAPPYPAYVPAPSTFFFLDIPLYSSHGHYWGGRGVWRRR